MKNTNQGLYGKWQTLALELQIFFFQAWKVMEFKCGS